MLENAMQTANPDIPESSIRNRVTLLGEAYDRARAAFDGLVSDLGPVLKANVSDSNNIMTIGEDSQASDASVMGKRIDAYTYHLVGLERDIRGIQDLLDL